MAAIPSSSPAPTSRRASVTAGILTNADYARLSRLAVTPEITPVTPKVTGFTRKQPKTHLKWDHVSPEGRRGLHRVHGRNPLTGLKHRFIEWIEPAPQK